MARINLVSPEELCDQHLLAEYRELPRIVNKLLKAVKAEKKLPTLDGKYRLGRGHVTFFHNKGCWLLQRFKFLVEEMQRRGFECNYVGRWKGEILPLQNSEYFGGQYSSLFYKKKRCIGPVWNPSKSEIMLSRVRIARRMPKTPRYYGKEIGE